MEDYSSPETKKAGIKQIESELEAMPEGKQKQELLDRIEQVKQGERDLYF